MTCNKEEAGSENFKSQSRTNRRSFMRNTITAGIAIGAGVHGWAEQKSNMPYRMLGSTSERVSVVGLGGHHIGIPDEDEVGIKLIRTAIDRGINFLDNCWDYHDGKSEVRMGKALRDGYRDRVFLMTKIDGQTRASAAQQIDESLRRLQTDHVDLMQFHEVIRPEDPDRIFGSGGSMEAMLQAKKAGKVRFVGFTGHKDPAIHLKMLDTAERNGFRFDAAQMPLNVMDAHFRSFERQVLPRLVHDGIAVLGMKPLASGHILETKSVDPVDCLHYAMSLPTSTVITGIDTMEVLDQAIRAATSFQPLSKEKIASLLARTAQYAAQGKFEPFKTSTQYDGTVGNPQWLGLG
jgi:aryl-alcohol dehydrogenase-like predicted oxidoreductase